jgi:DHA2 family multidrug resistance protein
MHNLATIEGIGASIGSHHSVEVSALLIAQQLAWQTLENLRQQQASSLAYFDVFLFLAVVTLAPLLTVLLMKRSVAEKGAHIGAE